MNGKNGLNKDSDFELTLDITPGRRMAVNFSARAVCVWPLVENLLL